MQRDKDIFDPTRPALRVTYGNTAKKHRVLDGDLIVLGRSSVCDFNLVSPEVAPVHCVLVRVADGWKLRDCSGRPGTRVNGKVVQEVLLDDGDIIQIGAFSFQAHLPPGHTPHSQPESIPPERYNRTQRSRRRLVEWVQQLRKQLGQRFKAVEQADSRLLAERADLSTRWQALQTHEREYHLRMTRLELSERDLATDRATLDKEYRSLQEEVERHTASVQQFAVDTERSRKELEERRAAVEAELRATKQAARPTETTQTVTDEESRKLELRARELEHFANHLRRTQQGRSDLEEISRLVAELRQAVAELRLPERRGTEPPIPRRSLFTVPSRRGSEGLL
jgi:pSer/pThr/pTyr-binding forkhead associated (FHA) protein